MKKREAERQTHQENTLRQLGFTTDEAAALRRISMTLRRWYELECGNDYGYIERDETTGKPYMRTSRGTRYPVADRETGAVKRLNAIIRACNERRFAGDDASILDPKCDDLAVYLQTDPRGAPLYILRPDDIPAGKDPAAYYSRGICIY
jgi:hypothetical protein